MENWDEKKITSSSSLNLQNYMRASFNSRIQQLFGGWIKEFDNSLDACLRKQKRRRFALEEENSIEKKKTEKKPLPSKLAPKAWAR